MTYGLSVRGLNDSYQIDSETTQTDFLAVISSGYIEPAAPATRATISGVAAGDIIWMNAEEVTSGGKYWLHNGIDSSVVKTNYIVTRKSTSLSSFSGDYGLQVYNSATPSAKIFDSRGMTEGVNIIDVKLYGEVGGSSLWGGEYLLEGAGDWVYGTQSSLSTILYDGDPTDIYVTTIGAVQSPDNYTYPIYVHTYYFDYTNDRILFVNYTSGFSEQNWPNHGMILIGKLQT